MSEERSRLAIDGRERASLALSSLLAALPELQAAAAHGDCVAGFAPTRSEIDPWPVLDQARCGGARVAWPRVASGMGDDDVNRGEGAKGASLGGAAAPSVRPRLRFHLAEPGELRPGRFGIAEPDPTCPEIPAGEVAVMLVPGLAFDARGNRLGFGGGYYDEVLSGNLGARPAFVVGVGYDFQVVDSCPTDERDARVDCLVTEARVIRCDGRAPISSDRAVPPPGARHSAASDVAVMDQPDGPRPSRRKVDP